MEDDPRKIKYPEPEEKNTTHLLDLNDDCLLKIFGFLDLMDLYEVSTTCTRLRDVANDAGVEHGYFDSNILPEADLQTAQYNDAACILRRFGHFIRKMNIDGYIFEKRSHRNDDKLMNEVVKCCRASLKELKVQMPTIDITHLGNLSSIETLSIIRSDLFCTFQTYLPTLKVLKLLNINTHSLPLDGLMISCPNLEELYFGFVGYHAAEILLQIISQTTHLRVLSLDRIKILKEEQYSQLFHYLKKLEYYEYVGLDVSERRFRNVVEKLSNIRTLKTIKLECSGHPVNNLLKRLIANNVHIECLHFRTCEIDSNVVKNLQKMKNLKYLMLDRVNALNDLEFNRYLVDLPLVNELHIQTRRIVTTTSLKAMLHRMVSISFFQLNAPKLLIDDEFYNNILNIVENRPRKIKLEMVMHKQKRKEAKPEEIKKDKLEWFEILNTTPEHKSKFRCIDEYFDILKTQKTIQLV